MVWTGQLWLLAQSVDVLVSEIDVLTLQQLHQVGDEEVAL